MVLLSSLCVLLQLSREIESLALAVALHGLGPYLLAFFRELVPDVVHDVHAVALHGPEPSVAGVALQEGGLVGGGEEDALSRVDLHLASVGWAIAVVLLGDEGLVRLAGGLLVVGQLAELDEPLASDLLHALLALYRGQRVVEPFAAEDLDEGGLADALRSYEREDVVVLASGAHHARHRGGEVLACHGACEGVVLCAEVVRQERVEPLHSVPLQALEPFPHGVERALAHGEVVRVQQRLFSGQLVHLAHVVDEAVVVAVVPVGVTVVGVSPWEVSRDAVASSEGVAPYLVLQPRVVLDYESEVIRRGEEVAALLIHLELLHPVGVSLVGHLSELLGQLRHALLGPLSHHLPVVSCEAFHLHKGGHAVDGRGLRIRVFVKLSEQVQAHHVEGVAELASAWVCTVVAERPEVVVGDHATMCGAFGVGPAVRLRSRCVDSGDEGLDGLGDAVAAAEGADDAGLRRRVLLLGSARCRGVCLVYGPLGHIAPVGVRAEDRVGVCGLAFARQSYELGVARCAGPVHEAAGLVGALVEQGDVYVVGDASGDGSVLLGGHLSAERHDQTEARLLGSVAVRGVEAPGCARQHVGDDLGGVAGAEVDVEGHEAAAGDLRGLAPASPEGAAHEAADVLHLALLGLGHGLVLGCGLGGALASGELRA